MIGTSLHEILCEALDPKSGEGVLDAATGNADSRVVAGRCFRMAVVVSVNVGLPRDVEWQGKTIQPLSGNGLYRDESSRDG